MIEASPGRTSALRLFHNGVIMKDGAELRSAADRIGKVNRPDWSREAAMPERIAVRSEIHFGKPCVAGTRIPVQSVLELVREGVTPATICGDYYPDLSTEDIRACVQYAIDLIALEDIRLAEPA
jgi:uncharacterized protein (DUF433 family)